SEEHTSELQSLTNLVCRLLLEKKKHQTGPADLRRTRRHDLLLRRRSRSHDRAYRHGRAPSGPRQPPPLPPPPPTRRPPRPPRPSPARRATWPRDCTGWSIGWAARNAGIMMIGADADRSLLPSRPVRAPSGCSRAELASFFFPCRRAPLAYPFFPYTPLSR